MRRSLSIALSVGLLVSAALPARAGWTPEEWRDKTTLQVWTIDADQNEHWSTLWMVVVHGDVYVRLGSRAADLMRNNTQWPYVKVRIGGVEFPHVRADDTPNMAGTVADAMADKYWTDILVRYVPHPMTLRLRSASP